MSGKLLTSPTRESIHIGNDMHVEDRQGKYINHSFDPTVRVSCNKLIATKDIFIGDEITFNYNESEINMHSPFDDDGICVSGNQS